MALTVGKWDWIDRHVNKSMTSAITDVCETLSPSNDKTYYEAQMYKLIHFKKAKLFTN